MNGGLIFSRHIYTFLSFPFPYQESKHLPGPRQPDSKKGSKRFCSVARTVGLWLNGGTAGRQCLRAPVAPADTWASE